jgi:glutamate dehydrogenase (NAD(P)+)
VKGKTVAVQGFGNVGSWSAWHFHANGAKVIAISDLFGTMENHDGIDVPALFQWKKDGKDLSEFPGRGRLYAKDSEQVLYTDCQVLVPAAMERVIHSGNAHLVKAKLIVEGANGPTTPPAEEILLRNGIYSAPDFLANGGGVTVSYFEWLKNLNRVEFGRMTRRWEEKSKRELVGAIGATSSDPKIFGGPSERDIVVSALDEIMSSASDRVWKEAKRLNTSLRMAAFCLTLRTLSDFMKEAGTLIS